MSESGSRGDFGSPPWGPVDPVGVGPDATRELPGLGTQRRSTAQHRDRPAGGSWGGSGSEETVVDAFTPIRRAPGDGDQGDRRNGHRGRHGAGQHDSRPHDSREPDSRGPEAQHDGAPGTDGEATGDGGPDGDKDAAGSPQAKPGARSTKRKRRRRSVWRELPVLVLVAVVLALVIKTYVVQAFYIPSGSMQNTLAIGDRVLINKVVYDIRGIDRGDIVVFNGDGSWDFGDSATPSNPFVRFWDALEGVVGITHGSDIYIKRVIGVPGDHVACCDTAGRVTVNGVPLSEQSYLYPGNPPSQQRFSIVVPPGRLWVMGDHRAVSYDSRGHEGDPGGGTIPQSAVIGRAFVIIWPPSRWGFLNIPGTFGQPKLTASAATALDNAPPGAATVRVQPAWSPLPLALGLGGAVPLTWLQRRARGRVRSRRRGRVRGRRSRPRGGGATRGYRRSV